MHTVVITVSANKNGRPLDSSEVAQWVSESLNNPDTMDAGTRTVVHSLHVEEEDA